MKPDDVCMKYATSKVQVRIWQDEDIVFVEGDSASLRFLSELLAAQADTLSNDGFQLSKKGAGSSFFDKRTKLGLYIHNTDAKA